MEEQTILWITIKYPSAQGIFNSGLFATVGSFLSYFFVLLIVIWVGYSIYAAYKIVLSQGEEKDIETGMTLIKNVWMSISYGMIFFIALSIIGAIVGIGDVTQWNTQLAQCKGSAGGFYFRDLAAQQFAEIPTKQMYCCTIAEDLNDAPDPYNELDFIKGTSHFIGSDSGGLPPSSYFSDCEKF